MNLNRKKINVNQSNSFNKQQNNEQRIRRLSLNSNHLKRLKNDEDDEGEDD